MDYNCSRYAESIDGQASEASSRATGRLSPHTDNHSAVLHSAYTSGEGYTRCIRVRRCRLPLMPCHFPSIRVEELASCHLHRLLEGTLIPVSRLRRCHTYHRLPTCHTDESHWTNHHHSPPLRILPHRTYAPV